MPFAMPGQNNTSKKKTTTIAKNNSGFIMPGQSKEDLKIYDERIAAAKKEMAEKEKERAKQTSFADFRKLDEKSNITLAPKTDTAKALSNSRYEEAHKVDEAAFNRNMEKVGNVPVIGKYLKSAIELGIKAQNSPVGKFFDRTGQSIQEGLTGNKVDKPMTGSGTADTIADVGGNIFSLFAPIGGGGGVTKNAISATDEAVRLASKTNLAQNALKFAEGKLGKTATNIGSKTLKSAAEGLGATAQEVGTKNMSKEDIKNSLLMNVGGGAGLGLVGGVVGKGLSKIKANKLENPITKITDTPKPVNDVLNLKKSSNIIPSKVYKDEPIMANRSLAEDIGLNGNNLSKTLTINPSEKVYKNVSELPKESNKVVLNPQKEKGSFKEALHKFYTSVVDTQHPISRFSSVANDKTATLAGNTRNVSGIVDHNILNNLVDSHGNKVGESLKSIAEKIPKGNEANFWNYMSHLHNIDRAREGKNVIGNYTSEMSALKVADIEKNHPEYKKIGSELTKWIDDFMQTWGIKTGIVNEDVYKGLKETYKNYFPTQREFSQLEDAIPDGVSKKFVDMKTPLKKATGSDRDVKDPLVNIMNLVNRTVRTAKYNEVGQTLVKSLRENPVELSKYAEILDKKPVTMTDNIVTVLENGKPTYVKFNNKALLDSFNGLPKIINSPKVLSTAMNLYKGLITQKNPIFAIRNTFRDIPTAYVYGSENNPFKFAGNLGNAAKEIVTNGESYQKYKALGGGGANFFNSSNASKAAQELASRKNLLQKGIGLAKKPIEAIEKFNNITEAAPRLAEFNAVLSKTGDVDKALAAANDVTVNFARGGNVTKIIDKGVPYLNAGVQGLDKYFRGFKNPKTAVATIVKSGVAISTPEIALYLINKDNPNYQEMSNRTKDSYYLIPDPRSEKDSNGYSTTFIKIPKSRELGVLFGSLLSRIGDAYSGKENAFKGFAGTVATNFSPANPLEDNIIAPVTLNLATNKDFAGRAIVPQYMLDDNRSPYLQYDDKTTEISKKIGELTKGVNGGLSPKQLDYLAKSYLGIIAQYGQPANTNGTGPLKALTNQFTADPLYSNQTTTDFYDKRNLLKRSASDKNIVESVPSKTITDEEKQRNAMDSISESISQANKNIQELTRKGGQDNQIKKIRADILYLLGKANKAKTIAEYETIKAEAKRMYPKPK